MSRREIRIRVDRIGQSEQLEADFTAASPAPGEMSVDNQNFMFSTMSRMKDQVDA